MTNRQKFIQVMNDTFGAGLTEANMKTLYSDCSPCGLYKEGCEKKFTCEGCAEWWAKEYKEPERRNAP